MAECKVCGGTLDENGMCATCNNEKEEQSADVWARPGSAPQKTIKADNHDHADKNIKQEDPEGKEEIQGKTGLHTISDPKLAQSQVGTAEQRAAYFNAIAGVDEEEVDEQFYVSETGLFDVPFNDTKENLGYNFPKFRHTISKKSKRKLRIGGIALAALSVITAGVIALSQYLNINIPIFEPAQQVPVLYAYGMETYITTNKGGLPNDIYYSDRRNTLTNTILEGEVKRLNFIDDYKRMLVVEQYDSNAKTYTLYERETYSNQWRSAKNNGTMVDNGICSPYKLFCKNDSIIYLKRSGDINDLCIYSFSTKSVKKIESGVKSFSIISDNKVLYIFEDNLYTLTFNSPSDYSSELTTEYVEQVVSAYDYGYTDVSDYFYVTIKLKYVTKDVFYNEGELHYIKDGKDSKIDTGVSKIIMPCFKDGTAYYYKSEYFSMGVSNFIEDDCEKEDAEFVKNIISDEDLYTLSAENWDKYLRHSRRNIKYGNQTLSVFDFGVYNDVISNLWYSDGKKGSQVAENITKIVSMNEDAKAVVYQNLIYDHDKLLFSQVEQTYIQNDGALINYCKDILLPGAQSKKFGICLGTKASALDASYIRQAEYTDDNSTVYYIDTEKEQSETGILKTVKLTDIKKSAAVLNGIKSFEVIGNAALSLTPSKDLYYNNEKIGQNVESFQAAENGKTVVFLADFDASSSVGTIKALRDNNVETICNSVHDFAVYSDKVLVYIGEYNRAEKNGVLYIASGIKEGKATANDAQSLVRY